MKEDGDLITMTRDEFFEQFRPMPHFKIRLMPVWGGYAVNPLDDCEFYPVDDELEFVLEHANNPEPGLFIWTHAFDSDGHICITDGYHLVEPIKPARLLGYYITSKPPEKGKRYYITPAQGKRYYITPAPCESEFCTLYSSIVVPNAAGEDVHYCGNCYDAYLVGLNRGMSMIIELPEQMKRARLAEALMEIRHLAKFDLLISAGRNVIEAFATGMCQSLNTELRTTEQFKRILLSRGGYDVNTRNNRKL